MKKESVEEFLARGGEIKQTPSEKHDGSSNSRFKLKDLNRHDNIPGGYRVRLEQYKKKTGNKMPRDQIMYLKFIKGFE